MSLSLIQGYLSAEDEDNERVQFQSSDDDDDDGVNSDDSKDDETLKDRNRSIFDFMPHQQDESVKSELPSAFDAFSEITGPPRFLNNAAVEEEHDMPVHIDFRRRHRKDKKKNLPAGVVMKANAQLVGMHERVRNNVEKNMNSLAKMSAADLGKREAEKKKGSTVKDKEKNKRMKGQSSHATWKSETEMHLRQQFD